ncbi:MAG: polysaccharide biosynthesis/export family protein, partial [Planctomycetia bacterium]
MGFGLLLAVAALTAGCAGSQTRAQPLPYRRALVPLIQPAVDVDYRLAAGDALQIAAPSLQESETIVVETDGCLHLTGGRKVRVTGLTADETAEKLARLDAAYAQGRVTVADFAGQFLYCFGVGADHSDQAVPYRGRETIEQLLARIGIPPSRRGWRLRVVRG